MLVMSVAVCGKAYLTDPIFILLIALVLNNAGAMHVEASHPDLALPLYQASSQSDPTPPFLYYVYVKSRYVHIYTYKTKINAGGAGHPDGGAPRGPPRHRRGARNRSTKASATTAIDGPCC